MVIGRVMSVVMIEFGWVCLKRDIYSEVWSFWIWDCFKPTSSRLLSEMFIIKSIKTGNEGNRCMHLVVVITR
jgi:hypothetical protein